MLAPSAWFMIEPRVGDEPFYQICAADASALSS